MGICHVVVGGQAGSESKGRVAADIMQRYAPDYSVRVAGPNAGHTAYDAEGRRWPLRQIPATAVVDAHHTLVIAAGSEIDVSVLQSEISLLDEAGHDVSSRLLIDPQATILEPRHVSTEVGMHERIGSTGKGVGAARAERIMRKARLAGSVPALDRWCRQDTQSMLQRVAESPDGSILIEGTQGFDLGLHAGYYPQCTSSDCRALDFLAMAGISAPWAFGVQVQPWVVLRTFPIRVAGNSGPMFNEVTWDDLARQSGGYIRPETTTVTKKVRRVGTFDVASARRAVDANGGSRCKIALSFLDYVFPHIAGRKDFGGGYSPPPTDLDDVLAYIDTLAAHMDAPIALVGTGPRTSVWMDTVPVDDLPQWAQPRASDFA